jgi:hypothetical protein
MGWKQDRLVVLEKQVKTLNARIVEGNNRLVAEIDKGSEYRKRAVAAIQAAYAIVVDPDNPATIETVLAALKALAAPPRLPILPIDSDAENSENTVPTEALQISYVPQRGNSPLYQENDVKKYKKM